MDRGIVRHAAYPACDAAKRDSAAAHQWSPGRRSLAHKFNRSAAHHHARMRTPFFQRFARKLVGERGCESTFPTTRKARKTAGFNTPKRACGPSCDIGRIRAQGLDRGRAGRRSMNAIGGRDRRLVSLIPSPACRFGNRSTARRWPSAMSSMPCWRKIPAVQQATPLPPFAKDHCEWRHTGCGVSFVGECSA